MTGTDQRHVTGVYRRSIQESDLRQLAPPGVEVSVGPFGETWTWMDKLGCERGRFIPTRRRT